MGVSNFTTTRLGPAGALAERDGETKDCWETVWQKPICTSLNPQFYAQIRPPNSDLHSGRHRSAGAGLLGYSIFHASAALVWKQIHAVGWGVGMIILMGASSPLETFAWQMFASGAFQYDPACR